MIITYSSFDWRLRRIHPGICGPFHLHALDLGANFISILGLALQPFATQATPSNPHKLDRPKQTFGFDFLAFFLFISVLFFYYEIEFRTHLLADQARDALDIEKRVRINLSLLPACICRNFPFVTWNTISPAKINPPPQSSLLSLFLKGLLPRTPVKWVAIGQPVWAINLSLPVLTCIYIGPTTVLISTILKLIKPKIKRCSNDAV